MAKTARWMTDDEIARELTELGQFGRRYLETSLGDGPIRWRELRTEKTRRLAAIRKGGPRAVAAMVEGGATYCPYCGGLGDDHDPNCGLHNCRPSGKASEWLIASGR
jgi:hypothetical protein